MRKKKKRKLRVFLSIFVTLAILVAGFGIVVTRYYPVRYLDIIDQYAREYGFAPDFICAVIHTESKFNEKAVSSNGACGLMQINEDTADWLADKMKMDDFEYDQIFNPELNIRLGCYYLNVLETRYGDMDVALCAYNAGIGNVDKWLNDPAYSSDGKALEAIPFRETRNYVARVASAQKVYAVILKFERI